MAYTSFDHRCAETCHEDSANYTCEIRNAQSVVLAQVVHYVCVRGHALISLYQNVQLQSKVFRGFECARFTQFTIDNVRRGNR